jgi:hypothetical protein
MALDKRGMHNFSANVFTCGAHSRRSRLVFAEVPGSQIKVGAISWTPPDYPEGPWWKSSERAQDFINGWLAVRGALQLWAQFQRTFEFRLEGPILTA